MDQDFLKQLSEIIENHISEENFGVSELAQEIGMSRSNLLRKIQKLTRLSASQYIRQERLKKGMELLRATSFNVSEVSFKVGFGSTSYFIKCFREYYGFPPGEVGKRTDADPELVNPNPPKRKAFIFWISLGVALILGLGSVLYFNPFSTRVPQEKSIAVLPFINDSNDSTNVYLINGLMESTLNNLQKIKDLKVISRTSVEKYRSLSMSIPEMAEELGVSYIVEGSGQKIGDHILLNIQLIEAATDKHLWAKQYNRETKDIFQLQKEVAKNIAEEIKAIITPEEALRIEKNPTENLEAYDLFLKGRDLLHLGGDPNLLQAINYFNQATTLDDQFALAYAVSAISYYYLDFFKADKKYIAEMGSQADKALFIDATLAESLVAKGLFFIHKKEYQLALPYLERALEYNPNSTLVINLLADFYYLYVPNTSKYLEYALKGVQLNTLTQDSITTSNNYLRLSHALLQSGFVEESLPYIDKSLAYNPHNPYSAYIKVWILFFIEKDLSQARERMVRELNKDTTRLDVLQELGKISYFMRDYESAYGYYKRFLYLKELYQLDIYKHEYLNIAIVWSKVGLVKESEAFLATYKEFADTDQSIYKHLYLMSYYAYLGDKQQAIDHLKLFSQEDNFVYWIVLWDMDLGDDLLGDLPELKEIMSDIEERFWKTHKATRIILEEEGLL